MSHLTAPVGSSPTAVSAGGSKPTAISAVGGGAALSADAGSGSRAPGTPRVLRPAIFGELVVVLLLLRAYDMIRAHAEVRAQAALQNGWELLHAERLLHIDLEPAVNRWTSLHHVVSLAASY